MDERFYHLSCADSPIYYWAHVLTDIPDEILWEGMRYFTGTVPLEIEKGGRPGDCIGNDFILHVVSERVIEVLEENRFREYSTYPVEVFGGKGPLPKYYGLTFKGKGGHILPEESGVRYKQREDGSKLIIGIERLVFDINQWDGSDLFYLEEFSLAGMVTARVKEAFVKNKLRNFSFTPFEEFSY